MFNLTMKTANNESRWKKPLRRMAIWSVALSAAFGMLATGASAQPVRALLITGGGWHDYKGQEKILTEGISSRANVAWTIDHEMGTRANAKIARLSEPGWAEGFDVAVYNMCCSGVTDVDYVEKIVRVHHEGLPAVVIHCAMHSFRNVETDAWKKFLGVTSVRHEGHRPFEVKNLQPDHPIMKDFPASWKTPKGELYMIEKVWPTATPLAQAYGVDTQNDHVTVWVNTYGQGRVFGTTIGHHNETMEAGVYLDLVTRGLLWATGNLDDAGQPRPGYGSDAGEGWISLFDGKTLDGWKVGENADSFKVEDGKIVVDGPRGHLFYAGPVADANFTDFEFKADVLTYPKANSGIYFHTKYQESGWPSIGYEAQVNATHGDRVKTGSLYSVENILDDAPHQDNEWFNYHIIVRGKEITFKVNGKTVLEHTEPEDRTGNRRLTSGTFALQAHDPGSRIYFRNIKVKLPEDKEEGFVSIFNGEDLSGWDGKPEFWRVENGAIIGETTKEKPTKGNTFLIWRDGEADDFELKLRYKITSPWANSGIQFRSVDLGDHVVQGYQADIATDDWITGINYEERGRGILARRGQKTEVRDGSGSVKVVEQFAASEELGKHIHQNDWNDYHIIVRGNHIVQKINGHRMSEFIDAGEKDARQNGILAFQLHSGPPMTIHFKDIRLKRLPLSDDRKKVVFVAGNRSHGYGNHEHRAGNLLLKQLLAESMPNIVSTIYTNGWPKDPTAFHNADAVVIYSNGGGGHPVIPHLEDFDKVMKRGVGLVCIHFAVEVPKGDPGNYLLDWIGGYFEPWYSVNPHWTLENTRIAEDHPITRGVQPYVIYDEWYYNMRFREDMDGVTAILSAVPPDSTLDRPDGPHSNNPHVREKKGQHHHVAWAAERPDGGRGFGFTGGHYHWNWGHPDQRSIVLNAIVWATGAEVPEGGVPSRNLTMQDLEQNPDYPVPDNFDRERIRRMLEEWQGKAVSAR